MAMKAGDVGVAVSESATGDDQVARLSRAPELRVESLQQIGLQHLAVRLAQEREPQVHDVVEGELVAKRPGAAPTGER